jgi:hypothetical protein
VVAPEMGLSEGASLTAVLLEDAAGETGGSHMATAGLGSWASMEDSRTSAVASAATASTCCGHVVHVVEKLPRLVSLIAGCGK